MFDTIPASWSIIKSYTGHDHQDIIEENPLNQPVSWISNIVITSKADEPLRMALFVCNFNKAIVPTNQPIPWYVDIKFIIASCRLFSKMDFKSTFWQIELEDSSRYLTIFYANNRLCTYKRLTMGIEPTQGELHVLCMWH